MKTLFAILTIIISIQINAEEMSFSTKKMDGILLSTGEYLKTEDIIKTPQKFSDIISIKNETIVIERSNVQLIDAIQLNSGILIQNYFHGGDMGGGGL